MSRRRAVMAKSALPYRELRYLASYGNAWIDTGIIASDTQFPSLDFKFHITENSDAKPILGQQWGYGYILFHSVGTENNFYIYYGDDNRLIIPYTEGDFVVEHYSSTGSTINGVNYSYRYTPVFANPYSIYLFSVRGRTERQYSDLIRMYYVKIAVDNQSVRDFMPVLWNANTPYIDGNTGATVTPTAAKPGMYDKVSKRLFVNQGTGADFNYA